MQQQNFLDEITQVINRYSEENKSNTPDFILAQYMKDCLDVLNKTIRTRDAWLGVITTDPTLITPPDPHKCRHNAEWLTKETVTDTYPYGETITYTKCIKCGNIVQ